MANAEAKAVDFKPEEDDLMGDDGAVDVDASPPQFCCFSSDSGSAEVAKRYLDLTDEELIKQCEVNTLKASCHGGQHRNKHDSTVRLMHFPTGVVSQAVEDYSQHMNCASALRRLCALLALKVVGVS